MKDISRFRYKDSPCLPDFLAELQLETMHFMVLFVVQISLRKMQNMILAGERIGLHITLISAWLRCRFVGSLLSIVILKGWTTNWTDAIKFKDLEKWISFHLFIWRHMSEFKFFDHVSFIALTLILRHNALKYYHTDFYLLLKVFCSPYWSGTF